MEKSSHPHPTSAPIHYPPFSIKGPKPLSTLKTHMITQKLKEKSNWMQIWPTEERLSNLVIQLKIISRTTKSFLMILQTLIKKQKIKQKKKVKISIRLQRSTMRLVSGQAVGISRGMEDFSTR